MSRRMDANQYVFVHGMRQTRSIVERWGESPWPVIGTWFLGALVVALALLAGVTLAASLLKPDYGFHYEPPIPSGFELQAVAAVIFRNSLVLALHAAACVAG